MKYLVEYKMHGSEIPYFIEDPGHFLVSGSFVGITKDSSECYVPKISTNGGDLIVLSPQELIGRVAAMTWEDETHNALTTEQKIAMAQAWLTEREISYE